MKQISRITQFFLVLYLNIFCKKKLKPSHWCQPTYIEGYYEYRNWEIYMKYGKILNAGNKKKGFGVYISRFYQEDFICCKHLGVELNYINGHFVGYGDLGQEGPLALQKKGHLTLKPRFSN